MAQRQFRNTDTDRWQHGLGNRFNDIIINTNSQLGNQYAALNASEGQTPNVSSFNEGDILVAHKSRGALAATGPTWELNRKSAGKLQYLTTREFLSNGAVERAQLVKAVVCKRFILQDDAVLTIPGWDQSKGGLGVIIADEVDLSDGTVDLRLSGFQEGPNGGDYTGGRGEGWPGPAQSPYDGIIGTNAGRQSNGNAPGSGTGTNSASEYQPSAGGAANKNNGANGSQRTSSAGPPNGSFGLGGVAAGNDDLSILVFSGAGSTGAGFVDGGGWKPSRGAGRGTASLIIICRKFKAPKRIIADGTDSQSQIVGQTGGASGSAGANVLVQGQEIDLGDNKITALAGAGTNDAGASSVGRIAARYSKSITGNTNPAASVTQDLSYNYLPSSSALLFFLKFMLG